VPTEYLNNGDSRADFAIVELDRPVGALTGSLGIQYVTGGDKRVLVRLFPPAYVRYNPFFAGSDYLATENLFQWAGYPARGFAGTQMRAWDGDYIFNDAYKLYFSNDQGPVAGESGSGAWRTDGTGSYVIALHLGEENYFAEDILGNHGDLLVGLVSTHTRITQDWFNAIFQIVPASFPSTPDLVPLDVRVGTANDPKTSVRVMKNTAGYRAGEPLPQVRLKIHNYAANGVTWTGTIDYEVYLSTDSTIDPNTDTKIGVGQITGTLNRRATASFNLAPVTLSANVVGGRSGTLYYLGIRIVTPDAATNNNITNDWDAMPIKVLSAAPRLTVSATLTRSGSQILATVNIANGGGASATNVRVTNSVLGSNVTTTALPYFIGNIASGQTRTATLRFPAMTAGTRTSLAVMGATDQGALNSTLRVTVP